MTPDPRPLSALLDNRQVPDANVATVTVGELREFRDAERARHAALVAALVEIVGSLVPTYHPDYPEDHGFTPTTAAIIRAALDGEPT